MKRTLLALFLLAVVNVAYSVWSRRHGEDEQFASVAPSTVQRAAHVRSAAAASPATPQTLPVKIQPIAAEATRPPAAVFDEVDKSTPSLPPSTDLAMERDRNREFLRPYRSGTLIDTNGTSYEVLNLRAVPKDEYRPEMGAVVTEKMNYMMIAGSQGLTAGVTLPVVARASNGLLGIVTGTFLVKIKDLSDVSPVARTHGLTLKFLDEDTKVAYFSAAPATSLNDVLSALKDDPSVENASLEVIQSQKRF